MGANSRGQGRCSVPRCPNAIWCRGRCRSHYRAAVSSGEIVPEKRRTLDDVMAEWEFLRGFVPFEYFGERVGMKQASWQRAFERAKAAGDPRAVRARNDPFTWPDPAAGLDHVLRDRSNERRKAAA